MDWVSPNVPVCQALKEKIKSPIDRSSRRVTEQFRDTVPYRPKLQDFKDVEGKSKKAIQMTKGRIAEWIGDLDLLRQLVLHNTLFDNYKYLFKFLS
ncbi:hypothetical protein MTR67_001909 [Solanum verrucosum]|uniref:Uncharacterized protein n=1 Tax=Solanum verrucosum TaxID=315347 RepID=A0AAF0PV66_SOLVR|nr:hypothetical protein MTR67_001909 [Solanum verrucosum]